jgi:hypothetical protein
MKILAKMKRGSIGGRKLRIHGVLLLAILATGCYDLGWGGGPGYYGNSSYYGSPDYYASPGYGNTYYSKNVYRGYGSYPQPGLFGGYAPAREAWDDSSRGRTSYSSGGHGGGESGEHGSARSSGHSGGESSGHGGTTGGGGGGHDGDSGHSHKSSTPGISNASLNKW